MNLMNGEEEIVCVGNFRTIDLGETLEVSGNYTEHPMYGMQLKAESYRVVEPDDEAGMERYLASGAIKGIGAALALRIIKKFGKDTFRIIEEEPERLAEIKGISEKNTDITNYNYASSARKASVPVPDPASPSKCLPTPATHCL